MTVRKAAAVTGCAVVGGWIVGVAVLYVLLMYGPDINTY